MNLFEESDEAYIQSIFEGTRISRKPLTGIVTGYHVLPYILVGPDANAEDSSIRLTGEITVGPKLVFSLRGERDKFEDIFDEPEPFMDKRIVGRTFSYAALGRRDKSIRGKGLKIERLFIPDKEVLNQVLDELEKREALNTGVIWSPQPRFYPVSVERFIISILDREFK